MLGLLQTTWDVAGVAERPSPLWPVSRFEILHLQDPCHKNPSIRSSSYHWLLTVTQNASQIPCVCLSLCLCLCLCLCVCVCACVLEAFSQALYVPGPLKRPLQIPTYSGSSVLQRQKKPGGAQLRVLRSASSRHRQALDFSHNMLYK